MDRVSLPTTITSSNGTDNITLDIVVTAHYISIAFDLYTGTSTDGVITVWTIADSISSATDFPVNPIRNFTFPIALFGNSTSYIGYLTIDTSGNMTINTIVANATTLTTGFYPFCVQYIYL